MFNELIASIKKQILLPDESIIRVLAAVSAAIELPLKPAWLFIVAPSSGGKTLLLNLLSALPTTYPLSSLTANTFISGDHKFRGIIYDLNGKNLTFKDFTTILSLPEDTRAAIMAQLREIWDGKLEKRFGTARAASWSGRVGFVAAVTTVIDLNRDIASSLGERFINYRLVMPDRQAMGESAIRAALRNSKAEADVFATLAAQFAEYVKAIVARYDPADASQMLTDQDVRDIAALVDFATLARSPVMRDQHSRDKEVVFLPTPEQSGRFSSQLTTLAVCLACASAVDGNVLGLPVAPRITPGDLKILYKIALDSIPQVRRDIVERLVRQGKMTTAQCAVAIGYPTNVVRREVENMAMLGVVERTRRGGNEGDLWELKAQYTESIGRIAGIVRLPEVERLAQEVVLAAGVAGEVGVKFGPMPPPLPQETAPPPPPEGGETWDEPTPEDEDFRDEIEHQSTPIL